MPESANPNLPDLTPTGYQRTQGGGVRWVPPTPEHLQTLLPQYDIEALIGRGGMGAVYRGRQRTLDRPVAIKLLPPEADDEESNFTERFKNEARIMAKLDHPAIVPVYDFGETSEGQLYFVMAFIDGTDIQRMIENQGRLPAEYALAITAHVCDALAYAHDHGVVHRDIKPSNILINREGQVKVADFGLAKADEPDLSGLTRTGLAMGTPDFVAPETLMQGVHTDGRVDLYAVGVMLYQMLTGNIPRGMFTMPSIMLPGTDPRFDEIIAKAMKYDREERYSSAHLIRADLDVILTTPLAQSGGPSSSAIPMESLSALKEATPQRKNDSVRPSNRSKMPLFVGGAALVLAAVGSFLALGGRSAEKAGSTSPAVVAPGSPPPIAVPESPVSPPAPSEAKAMDPGLAAPPRPERPPMVADRDESSPPPPGHGNRPPPGEGKGPPGKPPGPRPQEGGRPRPEGIPPGKWTAMLMPGDKLEINGSWKQDWIVGGINLFLPKFGRGPWRNLGIRLTIKGADIASSSDPCVVTFWMRNDGVGAYVMRLKQDGSFEHLYSPAPGAKEPPSVPFHPLHVEKLQSPFEPEKLYTLEFAIVGTKLMGRFDGKLMTFFDNDELQTGMPKITALIPIRDVQGIKLDGLSEAEALQKLEIGEDGSDLHVAPVEQVKEKPAVATPIAVPELAALDEQFSKLRQERVAVAFDSDLAKLNANYLGGLDREIRKEKAEGNLDGVLLIEAEKKLVTANQMPPDSDDTISGTHRNLRGIYRAEHAKLELTRASNLKALIDPLDARLRTLEADLTKKDRLSDAKVVRTYREELAKAAPMAPAIPPEGDLKPAVPTAPVASQKPGQVKDNYTNSLGMKFIAVKGTEVLFCIHETRHQDYAAFAAEDPSIDTGWQRLVKDGIPFGLQNDHPVMGVSWNDAQKFCAWLSKKEGKSYRLPTDREWSLAVGLGHDERVGKNNTPEVLNGKNTVEFPWGNKWPPPKDSGNYADKAHREQFPTQPFIDGYSDGYVTTSPVMTFKANKAGLYDMGGNAWEWVEDWWNGEKKKRVLRGGSWIDRERGSLLSSKRVPCDPDDRAGPNGFRCVLVP